MDFVEDAATVHNFNAVTATQFIRIKQSAKELEINELFAPNAMFNNIDDEAEHVMMRFCDFKITGRIFIYKMTSFYSINIYMDALDIPVSFPI